jgi:hypothetical protein
MKTPKEIEQLAESKYGTEIGSIRGSNPYDLEKDRKNGFNKGYTQCQEDMADKKYTEEDVRKAIEVGVNAEAGDYPKGFSYKLGISLEDYFINSLNKQD